MRTTIKTIVLSTILFSFYIAGFSQQVAKNFAYPASPDGVIGFLQFTPSDYGSQKHPLIIFMHGIGERGNGTTQINSVASNGIPNLCANGATMRFTVAGLTSSFVVLSPQLSVQYGAWPTFYVKEMIKYAKANLIIDTNRIYVTGLSLGGGGAWDVITEAPGGDNSFDSHIAAAAPVCGTQEENDASFCNTIGGNHLPIWAFHSMDDGVVNVGATQHAQILSQICGVVPAIKFTYYQSGNHQGAWLHAYDTGHITQIVSDGSSFTANPNLYEWFLGKTRATGNTAPVANAGTVQTITLPATTVTLTGSGTGTNGASINSYAWVKTSGPAAGGITSAGTASTTVTGLAMGTYVFTLTVTDNHALTNSSSVTITVLAEPVADAGPPQTIATTSTVLNAAGSYSPNGTITAYNWQQVSGPGTAVIVNAGTPTATINNMVLGSSYTFQLTVTDIAGASGSATTGVTVLNLLPVQYDYFRGEKTSSGNVLQWETANEQNNDYFSAERSTDGSQFTAIGKIAGAGTSTLAKDYTYTDVNAPAGNAYYRLRQVDKDGQSEFSQVILINGNSNDAVTQMYPNPVQDNLTIVVNNDAKGNGRIAVYDLTGRVARQQTIAKGSKVLNTVVNMNSFTPGLYIVEVKIGDNYKLTQRVMKK